MRRFGTWARYVWVAGGVVVLGVLVFGSAGCSIKLGAQQFDDPRGDGESRTRFRIEGEIASPRILAGHLEGTASVGIVSLERSDETLRVLNPDGSIEDLPISSVDVADVRLGARVYPLASLDTEWFDTGVKIEPYIVGGGGYYRARATERGAGAKLCCGGRELVEDSDTVAEGFFPYVGVGVTARFADQWAAFVEARQDFDRVDNGRDTSGTSVMIGLRWGY
ncbi:MAG: hypothetical protein AAGH99_08335 [Planctomycetota bacterium]